jgi:hypothetical protein
MILLSALMLFFSRAFIRTILVFVKVSLIKIPLVMHCLFVEP